MKNDIVLLSPVARAPSCAVFRALWLRPWLDEEAHSPRPRSKAVRLKSFPCFKTEKWWFHRTFVCREKVSLRLK
ncbi:hypothetical protein [Agrobacterium sp. M50-1]|uniref:hypothetical protein n=1 Tax=Agrobacterium sp. M50-1 TaxID=3132821 RepID=UPI003CE4FDCC